MSDDPRDRTMLDEAEKALGGAPVELWVMPNGTVAFLVRINGKAFHIPLAPDSARQLASMLFSAAEELDPGPALGVA